MKALRSLTTVVGIVVCICGYATTGTDGVVQIGPDTYMIGGLGKFTDFSGSAIKARLYQKAAEFCRSKGGVRHAQGWCLSQFHDLPVEDFDCGDADLNEYFLEDAIAARLQMTCETFALHHDDAPETVLGLVSVCNDVVAVKKLRVFPQFAKTPEAKLNYREWPAVKIARLAIRKEVQSRDIGTHLINLLKELFVFQNRTGCRVMTVDAYNSPRVLRFYQKNGFQFLTDKDTAKHTRSMWFDLLTWKNAQFNPAPAATVADSRTV